ncbi:hypothetical protein TcWFU_001669 [Taenia crassiceps]|uniref:Uncharacterized protein n=1 Tax=Taenia crassiceps TaxID=6207 RepID=A0ABR4Q0M8_9CEST
MQPKIFYSCTPKIITFIAFGDGMTKVQAMWSQILPHSKENLCCMRVSFSQNSQSIDGLSMDSGVVLQRQKLSSPASSGNISTVL